MKRLVAVVALLLAACAAPGVDETVYSAPVTTTEPATTIATTTSVRRIAGTSSTRTMHTTRRAAKASVVPSRVVAGRFCSKSATTGIDASGRLLRCMRSTDGRRKWKVVGP